VEPDWQESQVQEKEEEWEQNEHEVYLQETQVSSDFPQEDHVWIEESEQQHDSGQWHDNYHDNY
jgi:hypothetical protein